MTKIIYYKTLTGENPIKDFIESLQKKDKAKIFRIFQNIEQYGLLSVLPHIKRLTGTSFWEIRILGQDNLCFIHKRINICSPRFFEKDPENVKQRVEYCTG